MEKWVWRAIVSALILAGFAATGWNFKATADIPAKYVNKEDQKIFMERNDADHKCIEEKLDTLIIHLIPTKK